MINDVSAYVVTGFDRAAVSACPLVGLPGTPTTTGHLRRCEGAPPVLEINKFQFLSVQGSTVWRPPV